MLQTAISVIVPAYKNEVYIRQCLDSLLNQDFKLPYQVILIDCDSPDGCGLICKEYERKYPHLFYYYRYDFNHGVSVSRNLGLLHSQGTYVTFLDGDDFVSSDYLSSLYDHTGKGKYQVVTGGYYLFTKRKRKGYSRASFKGTGLKAIQKIYQSPWMKMRTFCWGRLYERKFLADHRITFDPSLTRFEDWLFIIQTLAFADRVCYFRKPIYYYRQHTGSLMSSAKDLVKPHLYAIENGKKYVFMKNPKMGEKIFSKPRFPIKVQLKYDVSQSSGPEYVSKRKAYKKAKEKLTRIFNGEE